MILRSRPTSALAAFVIAWDMQPASRAVRAEKGQGGAMSPPPDLDRTITLESGINLGVCLLIFEIFPGATSLLKGAMFIDFCFLKTF